MTSQIRSHRIFNTDLLYFYANLVKILTLMTVLKRFNDDIDSALLSWATLYVLVTGPESRFVVSVDQLSWLVALYMKTFFRRKTV